MLRRYVQAGINDGVAAFAAAMHAESERLRDTAAMLATISTVLVTGGTTVQPNGGTTTTIPATRGNTTVRGNATARA